MTADEYATRFRTWSAVRGRRPGLQEGVASFLLEIGGRFI
jgi:hypothetical protein